jgi:hypothetical protein
MIGYEMNSSGSMMALVAVGAANKYFFDPDAADMFDFRRKRITEHHSVVYGLLSVETTDYPSRNTVKFVFQPKCDAVSMVDLVVRDPEHIGVEGIVEEVSIEIGVQRIDKVHSATDLATVAAINGRSITAHNDTLFIPIALAPFQEWNVLPLIALPKHEVHIYVKFKEGFDGRKEASLFGDSYFLGTDDRRYLANNALDMMVVQSQWGAGYLGAYPEYGDYTVEGGGLATFKLPFNHPVSMIYFWGCKKEDIINVQLLFDDASYYDGPLEPLERMKEVRLPKGGSGPSGRGVHADASLREAKNPSFIFFSREPLNSPMQSTVNMSRLDHVTLKITTREGSKKQAVNVRAINIQPLRFSSGMAGLAFSK